MNIATQTRRIGAGTFAGYYRAYLVTTEFNSWGARLVTRYASECIRVTRADAEIDAQTGAMALQSNSYPSGFTVSSSRHIPHGF